MSIRFIVLCIAIFLLPRLAEAGPRRPARKPVNPPRSDWSPPKPARKPAEKPKETWTTPRPTPTRNRVLRS